MKYKVTGANRDNGARMTLEFEAESKAAAERKATQAGMSVNRVEDVTDGHVAHALDANPHRRRYVGGVHPFVKLVVIVLIFAAAYYFLWPTVRTMLRRGGGRGRTQLIAPPMRVAVDVAQHFSESESSRSS